MTEAEHPPIWPFTVDDCMLLIGCVVEACLDDWFANPSHIEGLSLRAYLEGMGPVRLILTAYMDRYAPPDLDKALEAALNDCLRAHGAHTERDGGSRSWTND